MVADKWNISKSTVYEILKKEDEIRQHSNDKVNLDHKVIKSSRYPERIQNENLEIPIVRRQPLQVVQQIIKYPVVKNIQPIKVVEDRKVNKRKQLFVYPREDLVEFYSIQRWTS